MQLPVLEVIQVNLEQLDENNRFVLFQMSTLDQAPLDIAHLASEHHYSVHWPR